ncbi:MAG: guanylate kinase [Chloroflexota bacterium]|nr:guanylate kinase [Chloroflexota bacterium]
MSSTKPRVVGAPGAQLVVISGPSGVGKDTIIRVLKERNPDPNRQYVITYKSRDRRPGEVDGVDYHFVSPETFQRLADEDAFLETAKVYDQWSGTPFDQVADALQSGRDAVLKVDVQGAHAVRQKVPDAILIFVAPPSLETLSGRLIGRATESEDQLQRRQSAAASELASQTGFDYVLVNRTDEADATAEEIERIVAAERARHPRRQIRV